MLLWQMARPSGFITRTFRLSIWDADEIAEQVMEEKHQQVIPFARGEQPGNGFYFWQRDSATPLKACPIIMFDGAETFIPVAVSLDEFLLSSLSNRYIVTGTASLKEFQALANEHSAQALGQAPDALYAPSNILAGIDLSGADPEAQLTHGGFEDDEPFSSPHLAEFGFFLATHGLTLPGSAQSENHASANQAHAYAINTYFTAQLTLRADLDRWQAGFATKYKTLTG